MRVLVTGGAGFIGSHVVDALLADGREVAVLDDLSHGKRENLPGAVMLYQVDLRDREATRRALEDFRPRAVSHHAAQASVPRSFREPHLDAEINVLGGLSLLDACARTNVERLVFASTGGAIYGEVADGTRAAEMMTPNPMSPYAIHKLTFERLLAVYEHKYGLVSTSLRYANVYGPRQDPNGEAAVVAVFCENARAGRALAVHGRERTGDAGCIRDYVYVGDAARANVLALRDAIPERVLNVGSGVATSTRELAEHILGKSGRDVVLESLAPREGDLGRSVLDPTLASARLGALVGLDAGLTRTLLERRSV